MNRFFYLLIGTYTGKRSKGVYVFRFDPLCGNLEPCSRVVVANPSFISTDSPYGYLYSVSENETGRSYANSFSLDRGTGDLILLNRRVTGGAGACHIAVDPLGQFAVTANYGGGSVSLFPIDNEGRLVKRAQDIGFGGSSSDPHRQDSPHPHCIAFSPDGLYMFVTDLGTDSIYRFSIDRGSRMPLIRDSLHTTPVTAGSGPRHMVFSREGNFLYTVNELSGTVSAFTCDPCGLALYQEIPIAGRRMQGGGAIAISADGAKLYATMREGSDGFAVFNIRKDGGLEREKFIPTAAHPRGFAVSPDGRYAVLAAMEDDRIEVYDLHASDSPNARVVEMEIEKPAYVGFDVR